MNILTWIVDQLPFFMNPPKKFSEIEISIKQKDAVLVERLLKAGARVPDWEKESKRRFRVFVIYQSSMDIVKLLLQHNHPFIQDNFTVYLQALVHDRQDIMDMVAFPGCAALLPWELRMLISCNCTAAVKDIVLNSNVSDLYVYAEVMAWAIYHVHWDVIHLGFAHRPPTLAQMDKFMGDCAYSGTMHVLRFFVGQGGSVKRNKHVMLQRACQNNQVGMVKYLLSLSANPAFERNKAFRVAFKSQSWSATLLLASIMNRSIKRIKSIKTKPSYISFMTVLVNLMKGDLRPEGYEEWKNEYYDGNVGMIVCSYLG